MKCFTAKTLGRVVTTPFGRRVTKMDQVDEGLIQYLSNTVSIKYCK